MTTINVKDASGATVALEAPLSPGRKAATAANPVVIATEDLAAITALGTKLDTLAGYLDGVEGALASIAGYTDGLEAGIVGLDTKLTAISGYTDGLEALLASIAGYTDGLESLASTLNSYVAPSTSAVGLTPHDTNALPVVPKRLYVGTGGDITLRPNGAGTDVVYKNVADGVYLNVSPSHIRITGTTASDIVGE